MKSRRRVAALIAAAGCVLALMAFLAFGGGPPSEGADSPRGAERAPSERHPVAIRKIDAAPWVATGLRGDDGEPIVASCQTCHATKPPDSARNTAEGLSAFHRGLTFNHGGQPCAACHQASDYDSLRLANGDSLPFAEAKTLCGQCHGPQARDYEHGAHGGMSGYWDLSRGPRLRNSCVHCHDPHSPKFQPMLPAPPPADRFPPRVHGGGCSSATR
jgi:hypothetical protein